MPLSPIAKLFATALAVALVATACGGGGGADETPQIATLETTAPAEQAADPEVTAASTAAPEAESEPEPDPVEEEAKTFEDAALDFAQCMRDDHDYPQWPDPNPGARLADLLRIDLEALDIDREDADFQEAIADCRVAFQGVTAAQQDFTPEQQAGIEDAVINIMACVRELPGYGEIPDPDFTAPGGLRGAFAVIFQGGQYDLADTLEAIDQCREELNYPRLGEG